MTRIPVSKYQGCGNDFIITRYDCVKDLDIKNFIVSACDRHTGIGADGAIFVKEDPLEMIYYNQDGSRAPMCGNGIRCFAAFCYDENLHRENPLHVSTLAQEKVIVRKSEDPFRVKVDMGFADYDPKKIGCDHSPWNETISIDGDNVTIFSFFMSTVHTVVFTNHAQTEHNKELGRKICHHPMFAEQTNVNFVEILDKGNMKVMTYERGCGVTLACGTGVCASVLTAYKTGRTNNAVDVHLEKGCIHIDIDEEERVFMTGDAKRIMKGEFYYD